ncbi:MAG: hypothetical protein HC945_00625 [Nitrosarchaeum sp.]|nr:hypothetical protein [Nitrosarchaeum sp.]
MEDVAGQLEAAKRALKVADHMLMVTYPLLKEMRLLLSITENLYKAMDAALQALVGKEREYRRIPYSGEGFEARLAVFRMHVMKKHGFMSEGADTLQWLHETLEERRRSPVEFERKGKFVMCSESYRMRTLSVDDLKKHMAVGKRFLAKVEAVMVS